ncbi:MAG: hypothetical protein GWN00_25155, partial [Aliifodinibius sp.]|nr:hypothetical protein [Fodinibius sp.]NIV14153.1 hypothetical protein [Fodinibius sp.]NIY27971.1 hypothetical protein [Fodinibius sp.]
MLNSDDTLMGWLEYKTDLFSKETMSHVAAHFEQLLTAAMENPDRELARLWAKVGNEFGRSDTTIPQAPFQQTYVSPRDRAELTLNQIWEDAFGISPIGIHDDFFELGGHSLLAVRLFALVEERTGHKLPLTTLFKAPTIAQLAELIRDDKWKSYRTSLIPIKPNGNRLPYFFVPPAGTTVLQYAVMVGLLDEEQPYYGLQPLGLENGETPHSTVEEMASYHLRDIQAFQPNGPYLL